MQNGVFDLKWIDVKWALIEAFVVGILAVTRYLSGLKDIFNIDVHALINVFVFPVVTFIGSVLASWLTSNKGEFLGSVNVSAPVGE